MLGAENVPVASPFAVCAKGVTLPQVVVKVTIVPFGTSVPREVSTPAVRAEVPPTSTVTGFADNWTDPGGVTVIVTGSPLTPPALAVTVHVRVPPPAGKTGSPT